MGRTPIIPVEKKARIVLSVIAGEVSVAEAARREQVSEQSIGRWKADFGGSGEDRVSGWEVRALDSGGPTRGRGRGFDPGSG